MRLVDQWGPQYDQDNVGEPEWSHAKSLIEEAIEEMGATPLNLARLESWIEHRDCYSTLIKLLRDFCGLVTPDLRRLYQLQLSNFDLSDERNELMT